MNLILLEESDRTGPDTARLRGPAALHVRSVLKAGAGDTIRIGQVDGPLGVGTIRALSQEDVLLDCRWEQAPPPRPAVDLLLALPRPKVMKRLWAQLAALGVGRIALVNAARVERFYFDSHVLDPALYRPLLLEGLQQAGDTCLPEVTVQRAFRPFVEDELDSLFGPGRRLLAQPGAAPPVSAALAPAGPPRALLAVGPEGGWVPFELDLLQRHGFVPVSLGPRPLRTDTACIALLTLVRDALRD